MTQYQHQKPAETTAETTVKIPVSEALSELGRVFHDQEKARQVHELRISKLEGQRDAVVKWLETHWAELSHYQKPVSLFVATSNLRHLARLIGYDKPLAPEPSAANGAIEQGKADHELGQLRKQLESWQRAAESRTARIESLRNDLDQRNAENERLLGELEKVKEELMRLGYQKLHSALVRIARAAPIDGYIATLAREALGHEPGL